MQFVCCTHVLNSRHLKMSRNISPSCHKHDRCIAGESLFVSPRNLSRRFFFISLGARFYFKPPSSPGASLESVSEGDSARGNQVSSSPATPRRCLLRSSSSLLTWCGGADGGIQKKRELVTLMLSHRHYLLIITSQNT